MKKVWVQPAVEELIIRETANVTAYCGGFGWTDEFSGPEDDGELDGGSRPGSGRPSVNRPGNRPGDHWGGGNVFWKPHH